MASQAQITANQANAKLSTGPKTPEGKARSSQNALRHGLTSGQFVVRGDEKEVFAAVSDSLRAEIRPFGALEEVAFTELLHATWNLRRVRRAECELCDGETDPISDDSQERKLDRFARYQARHERSYQRALRELRLLQTNRFASLTLPDGVRDAASPLVSAHRLHLTKRTQKRPFPVPVPPRSAAPATPKQAAENAARLTSQLNTQELERILAKFVQFHSSNSAARSPPLPELREGARLLCPRSAWREAQREVD